MNFTFLRFFSSLLFLQYLPYSCDFDSLNQRIPKKRFDEESEDKEDKLDRLLSLLEEKNAEISALKKKVSLSHLMGY
jgi:hypothetical protein